MNSPHRKNTFNSGLRPITYEDFKHKIRWLYLGRAVTVAPCIIVYIIIGLLGRFLPDIRWLFILIVFDSLVNAPYDFILKRFYRAKRENLLVSIMLSIDVVGVTIAMHIIGLQDGFFFGAMYLVIIIFAGILATGKITFFIATLASICYGGLTFLECTGIIPHISTIGIKLTAIQSTGWAVSHIMFFYIIAYLSNFYSSPLKLREEELYWLSKSLEKRLNKSHVEAISALLKALKVKDHYTEVHSSNVAWYSKLIAESMNLSQQMTDDIREACFLHDIGKIGIQDDILNKKGKLTPEELEKIKHHPEFGSEIITALSGTENVSKMVIQEHEHYDGSGYPKGLKGGEICLGAQIVAVADAFDVLVSERSYKEPISPDRAVELINASRGKQFNPEIADCFCRIYEENKDDILMFINRQKR